MEKDPYVYFDHIPNSFENPIYDKEFSESISNPSEFWAREAKDLIWTKKFTKTIDMSHPFLHKWFPDGEMNMCYNCIDRHVEEGRGE